MREDLRIVGVFKGSLCSMYANDVFIAHLWNLKYTGIAAEGSDTRMYSNEDTHIWLDYAVYE